MAKTPIAGKDLKLFIEKDGDFIIFGCLDDTTLNMESDTITTACKDDDDDGWETTTQGMKRWSMDLSGIYRLISGADVATNYSLEELFALFVSGASVNVRFGLDGTGNKQFAGAGKLLNLSVGAPVGDNATFSGTLTGQGPLTLYTVPA